MATFWDYNKPDQQNHRDPDCNEAHWYRILEERSGDHLSALLWVARQSSDPNVVRAAEEYDSEYTRKRNLRLSRDSDE